MRRYFVPEAIQTSAMDCGPASLKALLEGFGIHASYGRLREACQTGVDGTSIDALETAAVQLGLDASQVMIPLDHLFAPGLDNLPALVVVRQASGLTHFVVLWRRHGKMVQVMDPAVGRRWTSIERLLHDIYVHVQPVPREDWETWAASEDFQRPLKARIRHAGSTVKSLLATVPLARVDAATRMIESMIVAGALRRGRESGRVLARIAKGSETIPDAYWSAAPHPDDPDMVLLRGAVMIQVAGTKPAETTLPELRAALTEKPPRPILELWRRVQKLPALTIAMAAAVAALSVVVEAVLLRGFFDIGRELVTAGQRSGAVTLLLAFSVLLLGLEFSIVQGILRLARTLDVRLRLAFLTKIPRLEDRYFQSRPISDMGERSHNIHQLRGAPELAAKFVRAFFEILVTVAAISWFYPAAALPAALLAFAAIGIPVIAQPFLSERDLRLRSHSGALTRFYLDAMLGLSAIRAHKAARAVQREQEVLLGEWARAGLSLQQAVVSIEAVQLTASFGIAIWLVWASLATHRADVGGLLLLVYWVLNLPSLGQDAATAIWQYPMLRNTALRLTEPLGAPEAPRAEGVQEIERPSILIENVTVQAGGHTILDDVSVAIPSGAHVGIVGPSGAGKSSLVGLLLGWHRPVSGSVSINGQPLDAAMLDSLRQVTAWVDPQVQIWNRSLLSNLRYGAPESAIDDVLEQAELRSVLRRLPDGLESVLGESGALVSGGEGQRVRMGRAMGRHASLVILDEPARGLDRSRRRAMLERARERWKDATLICITHDVEDTKVFERVLVIDQSKILEDGSPDELASRADSRYRALLEAEDSVRHGLWASASWRRLRVESGTVRETAKKGVRA